MVRSQCLVNCAGLYADVVANICGDHRHTIHPCRGEYASVIPRKTDLISGLVYPVPAKVSLGVHLTKTAGGELWLGPTAKFIESKTDYEDRRLKPEEYLAEAKKLCPALTVDDLRLGSSGIRPKRYGPGENQLDFFIDHQPDDGRIIHLVGIESPGLTASGAIGEHVEKMVREILS
jgi:glycerol-3-phosphate dehydrogenase